MKTAGRGHLCTRPAVFVFRHIGRQPDSEMQRSGIELSMAAWWEERYIESMPQQIKAKKVGLPIEVYIIIHYNPIAAPKEQPYERMVRKNSKCNRLHRTKSY